MENKIIDPVLFKLQKNKKRLAITLLIVILSIIVIILNVTGCNKGDNSSLQAMASTLDSLKFVHYKTISEYGASKIKYDELLSQKVWLDSMDLKKSAEVNKLNKEIKKLKSQNNKLATKLKKKDQKVGVYSNELSGTNDLYKEQIKQLQQEKDKLEQQFYDLLKKYDVLKELASLSHASNIRFEPLHEKKNGKKEKLVTKARKMNLLRIKFDIDENLIAEDGKKELFLVIKDPNGKLLSNENNNSGHFTASNGNVINYSLRKEINIQHGAPVDDLVTEWKQEGEHVKGIYSISIYNDGHRVGLGVVNLK